MAILFSPHGMLSINVKVLVSSTGKIHFVVCDALFSGLLKYVKGFETIKLHRVQVF